MKIKSLLLYSIIWVLFSSQIFAATSGFGVIAHEVPKDEDEKRQFFELLFGPELVEKYNKENIRSIFMPSDIMFDKTYFYSANYFFLGADPNYGGLVNSSALMRAYLNYDSSQEKNVVAFAALAPQNVYLNNEMNDGKIVTRLNPIYNNRVTNLTLMGRYPVVTLSQQRTVLNVDFDANQLICLVQDADAGNYIKTNTVKIKDANGDDSRAVVGLSASIANIFAAVAPNGGNFGEVNSGFATLNVSSDDKNLKQIGNSAFKLDLDQDQLIAITQAAQVGGLGDMYWDSNLQRLFIGLTQVERDDVNNAGGAVSLLVGRIENNVLTIEPAVNLNQNLFTANSTDYIFGFYSNNTVNVSASVRKIRTMQTSTNFNYLIVNASAQGLNDKIYALPLVPSKTNIASENIGKVANKNSANFEDIIANENEMTVANDSAAFVGGSSVPIPTAGDIIDMFVVGDSVYVCLNGSRDDIDKEAGIFKSTALFDQDGKIRAWTPWQRVMGSTDKVYGAGLDSVSANFWYLTDQNALDLQNTVKVTQWGKSDEQTGLMGNGLVELLNENFEQKNVGVHQTWNFDEFTPSFNTRTRFSMLVAVGYQKVAIIETGKHLDNGTIDAFTPTSQFVENTNVFFFEDQVIKDIGPICCSEVSRIPSTVSADSGWLFVGGYQGLAVLRQNDGSGWNNLTELSNTGFPGDGSWSFKELKKDDSSSFFQVRKIICDGTSNAKFLYVMNADSITRIKMDNAKFADAAAVGSLANKNITPPSGALLDMLIIYRNNTANQTRLLVATTTGLFYSDDINDNDENKVPVWNSVQIRPGVNLEGPISHLNFLGVQKGGFTINGNLYVLAADLSLNLANIYRFDIENGNINHIAEPGGTDYFYSIGQLRSNIQVDGSFAFNLLPKHLGKVDFLRKINIGSDKNSMRISENVINLNLEDSAYNIGLIVRNTASGGWVVPGDWGIRVNE
ncbi:hypothetical protein GF322_01490 [Candidatus Dependentiae bacterium]|nr:hypothetical protein [Candidatus Dependentiae bacterium]